MNGFDVMLQIKRDMRYFYYLLSRSDKEDSVEKKPKKFGYEILEEKICVWVDKVASRELQNWAFNHGFKWSNGDSTEKDYGESYLYFYKDFDITFSQNFYDMVNIKNATLDEIKQAILNLVKEDKVEEVINAKRLLELNACEDGFKWFVENFGKDDVPLNTLDAYLDSLGKTSYMSWLHDKFPQLKKKERTFKVGDKFNLHGDTYMLARIGGLNVVTLVSTTGTQMASRIKIVRVENYWCITEDEMKKIYPDYGTLLTPL